MMTRHISTARRAAPAAGFTLLEAVVAMAITAVAASALLLGIDGSMQTTTDSLEQTIAAGMARQLLHEVVGTRYSVYAESSGTVLDTAHDTVLRPSTWKAATGTRERFTDSDDFNGFRSQPPEDTWGVPLGQEDVQGNQRHASFHAPPGSFANWRQEIDVYYVSEADLTKALPSGQVSDYRAVEVRIVRLDPNRGNRVLATLRQVIAYVPPLP